MAATVGALVDAFNNVPAAEHRLLRQIARMRLARAPTEFDASWREATGDTPHWLKLDLGHEWLVDAWWNTPTWWLSRDYLKSHPALLDGDTDNILEEIAFSESNN